MFIMENSLCVPDQIIVLPVLSSAERHHKEQPWCSKEIQLALG